MRLLNEAEAKHVPRIMKEGTERNYNYLIMTLLGPSTIAVAAQAMDALRYD